MLPVHIAPRRRRTRAWRGRQRITTRVPRAGLPDEPQQVSRAPGRQEAYLGRSFSVVTIPVVDGVAAAVKTVESLVALGLRTSKRDEYATPPAKAVTGALAGFALASGTGLEPAL